MDLRITTVAALITLGTSLVASPSDAGTSGRYVVHGVEDPDMLKLRSGPGIGYTVIVGLPNGAVVHVKSCEAIGHTSWCKVSLDRVRQLKGYVSKAYLKKI